MGAACGLPLHVSLPAWPIAGIPQLYDSTLSRQSLGAMLMATDRFPLFRQGDQIASLLHTVRWAYHLDNERFVDFLRQEAGPPVSDASMQLSRMLRVSPDGSTVVRLITDDGQTFAYDLYIDCSGFRSFLLEQRLGSKFLSYGSTLFTDRALAAKVPHDGVVRPYTLAETMKSGWCWKYFVRGCRSSRLCILVSVLDGRSGSRRDASP